MKLIFITFSILFCNIALSCTHPPSIKFTNSKNVTLKEDLQKLINKAYWGNKVHAFKNLFNHNEINNDWDFLMTPGAILKETVKDINGRITSYNSNFFYKSIDSEISEDSRNHIFYQKNPLDKISLLITTREIGWRGNSFSMAMASEMSTQKADHFFTNSGNGTLISNEITTGWIAPIIIRHKKTHQIFILGIFTTDSDKWEIYTITKEHKLEEAASVNFAKSTIHQKNFPHSVNKLKFLLEKAQGEEDGSHGTLMSLGHLNRYSAYLWGVIMNRPHVILQLPEPYNTQHETNEGFKKWAQIGSYEHNLYTKILQQLTVAEKNLSQYYQTYFNYSAEKAHKIASTAIQHIYSASFTFPKA